VAFGKAFTLVSHHTHQIVEQGGRSGWRGGRRKRWKRSCR
jgi:hypothetical protein